MGVGALVAGVITSRMTERYEATAVVAVPAGAEAVSFLDDAEQADFVGADGAELQVSVAGDSLSFAGSAERAAQASSVANTGAEAFVASASDPSIRITAPAETPTSPSSPKRLQNSLIGVAAGALLGLLLQSALRPARRDESVAYVPSWTGDAELAATEAPLAAARSGRQSAASRPLPVAARERIAASQPAGFDAPDVVFAGEAVDKPVDEVLTPIDVPGGDADPSVGENWFATSDPADNAEGSPDLDSADLDHEADLLELGDDDEALIDQDLDDMTPDEESNGIFGALLSTNETDSDQPEADEHEANSDAAVDTEEELAGLDRIVDIEPPAFDKPFDTGQVAAVQGFQSLVQRTTVNLDPMVDRFADESTVTDPATYSEQDAGLVEQISFLTDEVQRYQQRLDGERARHLADRSALEHAHGAAIVDLEGQLADLESEVRSLSSGTDDENEALERRIEELESELTIKTTAVDRLEEDRQTVLDRHQLHDDDLAAENQFLRSEVERYQTSLDGERVDHATALAGARLENQDELDRTHREHRVTLNQLAQTNRNLLTAQRNEAESMMAALEAQHQASLDEAHTAYEERLRLARAHLSEQLATSHDRVVAETAEEHEAQLEALVEQLDVAHLEQRRTQERLDGLLKDQQEIDRRSEQLKRTLDHTTRGQVEERRRLENRNTQLEELVTKSEERLAQERRRTSEVVRNLLQESATSAAEADWARKHMIEGQRTNDTDHQQEIATLVADAQAYERATAQREYELEATIASLRARIASETSASDSL